MITKGKIPISGGKPQFRPTPNVLSDTAHTSRDAQKFVKASPSPMQNRQGPMNVPAGVHEGFSKSQRPYGSTSSNLMPRNSKASQPQTSFSIHKGTTSSASDLAAVGEPRLPKGYNSIQSGYPTRGAVRTVGGGNQPSAKQRAQYPGNLRQHKYRP
jgi:hypothetical protein